VAGRTDGGRQPSVIKAHVDGDTGADLMHVLRFHSLVTIIHHDTRPTSTQNTAENTIRRVSL